MSGCVRNTNKLAIVVASGESAVIVADGWTRWKEVTVLEVSSLRLIGTSTFV